MSKYIAIDLDPQGLFVVSGTASGGAAKVDLAVAWSGTEAEGGPPALTAETAQRVGEQLRDRLRAERFSPAPVVVSVPRDRVILKELRYPVVPLPEEPNIVRFQALKELSDAVDDVIIDYIPLTHGAVPGERRSMAVVLRKDLYKAIQVMCEAANLKLVAVTPRPYAVSAGLMQAFRGGIVTPLEAKTDAFAALTLGPAGGEFTVSRGGDITFTRTIPAPVLASDSMLVAEVRRNITMYAGANPGQPVQGLYIAEADGRWAPRLRAALGIPVTAYDPLAGAVPEVPAPLRGRFAGAVGLLAVRSAAELPLNFVTPRQPRAEADPKRKQLLVAGLLAFAVVAVGGIFGWMQLGAADDRIASLAAEKDRKDKEYKESAEIDKKRLDAVNGWTNRRVVWLDELFDMADRFPVAGGFYATNFTGTAIAPDQKTGKQEFQADIALRVAARDPAPVNSLVEAIIKEATDPKPANPKQPATFYASMDKRLIGPDKADPLAKEYSVSAKVNSRTADKFARNPAFSPPDRTKYPPVISKETKAEPVEKEPDATPADPKDTPPVEK